MHEADVHDLSLDVVHALDRVDVKALSYVQLLGLYAGLMDAVDHVARETELR